MMALTRSDFGANPHLGAPRNVANGWVGVWPKGVPQDRLGVARAAGVAVAVQKDLVDLVETLLTITEQHGYDVKAGQTWGYANRAIRGTRTPSNHSRGKAVDINSLANPMQSAFKTNIPPAVVHAWEACGWYWGGRYGTRPDAMHFEYLGRPSDVAEDLATAKTIIARLQLPTVDLSKVLTAAKATKKYTGLVAAALAAEKLTPDVAGYARWQRSLGYSGADADGYAGRASLTKLGTKHGFTVVA